MNSSSEGYTALKTDRYERKFRVSNLRPAAVETIVKNHPALFREIYQRRWINNIYFDTQGMMNYHDNVVGRSRRQKARIRWYGDLEGEIARPILEIKIKNGMTGTKKSFLLPPFTLSPSFDSMQLTELIRGAKGIDEDVMESMKGLQPTLVNRYARTYFLEFSRQFRVTIDQNLSYYAVMGQSVCPSHMRTEEATVVELKYDFDSDEEAARISTAFPFRMTKNSKYVNGIDLCREVTV